jgi:hypothetical protein
MQFNSKAYDQSLGFEIYVKKTFSRQAIASISEDAQLGMNVDRVTDFRTYQCSFQLA